MFLYGERFHQLAEIGLPLLHHLHNGLHELRPTNGKMHEALAEAPVLSVHNEDKFHLAHFHHSQLTVLLIFH